MSPALGRGLRRVVDALQRTLFDEPATPAAPVAAPPAALPYTLRRSRRRSIGFSIGDEGLVVSAPKWVSRREIDAAVAEKRRWVEARLAEQRERAARLEAGRVVWADGAVVRYLGAPLRVVLDGVAPASGSDGTLEDAAACADGIAVLRLPLPHGAAPERLRDAVQSWLQRRALALFHERCRHFEPLLGVRVTRLALSSAKTRWGSASGDGSVRLHWRLVHFAPATIDYVVAHELAHLREMNHGPRFWHAVRSVVPDCDDARRALRRAELPAWEPA